MGERYALALANYAEKYIRVDPNTKKEIPARLWTSTLKRTQNTARHITQPTIIHCRWRITNSQSEASITGTRAGADSA